MYARKVGDQELNLTVSGWLWNRSLIMRDVETGTMWSHILGKAMEGKLKGRELELIPSQITTWKSWKTLNPSTTVLDMSRTAKEFVRELQQAPGRFVLGVHRLGKEAKAYPYDTLKKEQVVNDRVGKTNVVVFFDRVSTAAAVYSREVDDKTLTFELSAPGMMRDKETGSSWDSNSGRCLKGKLEGNSLKPITGVPSFRKAWFRFFPESAEYGKEN